MRIIEWICMIAILICLISTILTIVVLLMADGPVEAAAFASILQVSLGAMLVFLAALLAARADYLLMVPVLFVIALCVQQWMKTHRIRVSLAEARPLPLIDRR